MASTRGVIQGRTRELAVAWTPGVVRGLGRALILSAAGGWTLAVIPARPRGVSPVLACAVAPAGTVPVRIR